MLLKEGCRGKPIAKIAQIRQGCCETKDGYEGNLRKEPGMFLGELGNLNPNRSLDFGEIARLCHAACFSPSRRRSGLRRGVARNRMRTEAGKMPESLIFLTENSPGVSNDRFGLKRDG